MDSFGRIFRITTFGESHGKAIGCVIENVPAGLPLREEDIQKELDRRRPGQSRISTPRKEKDQVEILSGVFEGRTTGTALSMLVYNTNIRPQDYAPLKDIYRPSHADYTYEAKYGIRDYRGGGRASARTTIGIVCAGAVAKKILREYVGVDMCAYVYSVKDIEISPTYREKEISFLKEEIEKNPVRTPDQEKAKEMEDLILQARKKGDSVGGIIELVIDGVPPGWGDPIWGRLDALLAYGMLSIPASKGIEIGSGFAGTRKWGSEHNDPFYVDEKGRIRTLKNDSGGIQGGISNGERIFLRVAFKPPASIRKPQKTINRKKEEVLLEVKGRHDPCVLPRAVPIVEAVAATILVDQYLLQKVARIEKISGQDTYLKEER